MKDIKLFERWIKKALNDRFWFQALDKEVIVTNGFVAFKIKRIKKDYIQVIKEQTFQDLNENFMINSRKLTKDAKCDLEKHFDKNNKEKIINTHLKYEGGEYKNLKIFKSEKGYIFVDEKNLEVSNINDYEVFGSTPIEPITLVSDNVEILALPVRICMFPYEIKAI